MGTAARTRDLLFVCMHSACCPGCGDQSEAVNRTRRRSRPLGREMAGRLSEARRVQPCCGSACKTLLESCVRSALQALQRARAKQTGARSSPQSRDSNAFTRRQARRRVQVIATPHRGRAPISAPATYGRILSNMPLDLHVQSRQLTWRENPVARERWKKKYEKKGRGRERSARGECVAVQCRPRMSHTQRERERERGTGRKYGENSHRKKRLRE